MRLGRDAIVAIVCIYSMHNNIHLLCLHKLWYLPCFVSGTWGIYGVYMGYAVVVLRCMHCVGFFVLILEYMSTLLDIRCM